MKSLDSGCPVFMSAVAGIVDGHAWVIDGYKIRNYTSPEGRIDKTQNIVHCNWGGLGIVMVILCLEFLRLMKA